MVIGKVLTGCVINNGAISLLHSFYSDIVEHFLVLLCVCLLTKREGNLFRVGKIEIKKKENNGSILSQFPRQYRVKRTKYVETSHVTK